MAQALGFAGMSLGETIYAMRMQHVEQIRNVSAAVAIIYAAQIVIAQIAQNQDALHLQAQEGRRCAKML